MKKPFIFLFSFIISFLSFGQRMVVPLEFNPEQAAHHQKNSKFRLMAVGDTLDIPFFDDFTQSTVSPEIEKWETGGGTFINSTYPINPPNFNVATFDGLKENGTPYNVINVSAVGATDKLTSRPIDLSGASIANPAYLRFYWQGGGIGEQPDSLEGDSIMLQFKNVSGVWKRAWSAKGTSTPFNHQLLLISDAAQYYFKGFQFRFQSYGRQTGSYDIWNIDYIHLDTGRIAKENWFVDFSFTGPPTSFLKNYSAMPIKQYASNKVAETADTIKVGLTSLYNQQRTYYVFNPVTPDQTGLIDAKVTTTPYSSFYKNDSLIYYKPDDVITSVPQIHKYKFSIEGSNGDPKIGKYYIFSTIPGDSVQSRIDFTQNDSISGYTNLTDYYAYDDGTAEFGYGVNQELGKIAVEYNLNVVDTLTHVDIYFPRIETDRSTASVNLSIWSYIEVGGREETALHRETVIVKHTSALNSFHRYKLSTPLPLPSGIFYVGFQQQINDFIFAGLDKNNNRMSKIFYNVDDTWSQENDESGSLMIRPVFGDQTLTSIGKPDTKYKELACEIYPNPSVGQISIAGKVSTMHLYDITGKLLFSKEFDGHSSDIKNEDLSFLPNGFYIIHLENEDSRAVKKIILNR